MRTWRSFSLSALLFLIGHIALVQAGESCAHCGCAPCQKVCRLVCEEKKVPVTCWGCKAEDFCVPGPSRTSGQHTECVCGECDPNAPCVKPKKFVWTEWIPGGCPKVYTKHKLMRKTITKTVPSYKWVVEYLCPACEGTCDVATLEPDANIPPPPAVKAKLLHR